MRLNYPPEYRDFVNSVRRKARYYGVEMRFTQDALVYSGKDDKDGSSGYFWYNKKKPELAVATGTEIKRWILTLIHESCHMDQQFDGKIEKEKMEWWDKSCIDFFEWLEGKKQFNKVQISKITDGVVDLELDCEQRSLEKINKFGLPIAEDFYCRKANTYLFGYYFVKDRRKWYNTLYHIDGVWQLAPPKLLKLEEYKSIPLDLKRAFKKHTK